MSWWAAALQGVASLASGMLGNKSEGSATRQTNAANYKIHQENLAAQKEALQNTVQWRIEDARRAGVHPLYALGAQPMSVSPTGAFMQKPSYDYSYISDMGQNVSRAMDAMRDRRERNAQQLVSNEQQKMNQLTLERAALENDLIRSQIARNTEAQIGPPAPSPAGPGPFGTTDGNRVRPQPAEPVVSASGNVSREAGSHTAYSFQRTPSGGLSIVPSYDAKQRMEDSVILEAEWFLRNRVNPWFSGMRRPSTREFPLPAGYEWRWSPVDQEFRPRRIGSNRRNPIAPSAVPRNYRRMS